MISILAGQTLIGVRIEWGTLANGTFKAAVPPVEAMVHPTLVDNGGTYAHQFPHPPLAVGRTYSLRVKSVQRGPITYQPYKYATITVP